MNYTFSEKVSQLQPSAIREILKFTSDPEVISFAAGNPAPEAFPIDVIRDITARLFEEEPITVLQYGITEGYTPLRELLKERMAAAGCFREEQEDLLITSGAQQVMELAMREIPSSARHRALSALSMPSSPTMSIWSVCQWMRRAWILNCSRQHCGRIRIPS